MIKQFLVILFSAAIAPLLLCCGDNKNKNVTNPDVRGEMFEETTFTATNESLNLELVLQSKLEEFGLVDVQSVTSEIWIDLRYASNDNFTGKRSYDTITKVYLQKEVIKRLVACQVYLDSIKPGYHLLVYDALRPLSVQQKMWEALDTIPSYLRGKFVSNPQKGSVHNYGAAVDITICDQNGNALDMGAGYDDFNEIAQPVMEWKYIKTGELSLIQVENRRLLRKVMHSQRFSNIPGEWWHFNAYSREYCKNKFPLLLNESGDFIHP